MEEHVIKCTLSSDELTVRGQRWRRLRDRAAAEVVTLDTGLRLRFRDDPGIEAELRELADMSVIAAPSPTGR